MHSSRPLTKRPRAFLACNACKAKKTKCDSGRPACERCMKLSLECIYTQNSRDRRLDRREGHSWLAKERNRHRGTLHADGGNPAALSRVGSGILSEFDGSDQVSTAESPADVVATKVFDYLPSSDIGYFGASSNHALFWFLSANIANLGHRDVRPSLGAARSSSSRAEIRGSQAPLPTASMEPTASDSRQSGAFPERRTAIKLITRFFDTVGAVLPYISEPALLKEIDRPELHDESQDANSRSLQSLMSIVFAYALYTMQEASPEPFYRRALRLLHGEALHVSNLESLQALLLLGSFEQNSRRAMASLTSHALAVKISYQLGIHAPSSYEHLGNPEKELRSKVWLAVVNQDRILSAALGRPCLIPSTHVRADLIGMLMPPSQQRIENPGRPIRSSAYFAHFTSLHEIACIALETIYESNISSLSRPPLESTVAKTLDLSLRLERWRERIEPFEIIGPDTSLDTWNATNFEVERHAILLSLYYYRNVTLVHGAPLLGILEQTSNPERAPAPGVLQDTAASLLKNDLAAVKGFHKILSHILQQRSFLERNAVWWPCNYTALTICWHLLGFWLLASSFTASFPTLGMGTTAIEALLREGLQNLISVGGSSMMSSKAYRCLHGLLNFLKNKATEPSGSDEGQSPMAGATAALQWASGFPFSGGQLLHYPAFMVPGLTEDELFGHLGPQDLFGLEVFDLEYMIGGLDPSNTL